MCLNINFCKWVHLHLAMTALFTYQGRQQSDQQVMGEARDNYHFMLKVMKHVYLM